MIKIVIITIIQRRQKDKRGTYNNGELREKKLWDSEFKPQYISSTLFTECLYLKKKNQVQFYAAKKVNIYSIKI